LITAQSLAWLEEYLVWRKLGRRYPEELSARQVEAFVILEQALEGERQGAGTR